MDYPVILVLIMFSAGLGVTLLASNLAAMKVWNLLGIPVDGGIWLFPVTYVLGDLLVDIYGEKTANIVALCCTGFTVLVIFLLCGIKILPDFPGADNTAYEMVQGAFGRTSLASAAGFLCSQIVNNRIFVRVRLSDFLEHRAQNDSIYFRHRALISSAIAHGPDALLFETLAFLGRISLSEFLLQAGFAYVAGVLIEIPLSKLTSYLLIYKLDNLHYSDGKKKHY